MVGLIGVLTIIFVCLESGSGLEVYQKITHQYDPQAVCLDGSPGGLYFHQGKEKSKFLIFLIGGAMCGGNTISEALESCYSRSKTILGSSKNWPQTYDPQGYLSTDPKKNQFAEWTKVIFGYCDGVLHQGYTKQPYEYKGVNLYFRGNRIVKSHFDWLNKNYNLFNADHVVFTGASAGAIGSFIWTNYLQSLLVKPNVLETVIDSGIFLKPDIAHNPHLMLSDYMSTIYSLSNRDDVTPMQQCNQLYPNHEWTCLSFQNVYDLLKGPILVIGSQYDSYSLPNYLNISCLKRAQAGGYTLSNCNEQQIAKIESYRKQYLDFVKKIVESSPNLSVWSISCSNHVYACYEQFYDSPNQRVPSSFGFTTSQAITKFVFEKQRLINIDMQPWPSNSQCAY